MTLANKYYFRPDQAFDEIELMLRNLQNEVSSIRSELNNLKSQRRRDHPHPIGYRWSYEAMDPVYFSDQLSVAEEIEPGKHKRWVLGDQPLSLFLRLRRDISYRISVGVADMAQGAEPTATVDGQQVAVRWVQDVACFFAPRDVDRFDAGDGLHLTFSASRIMHDGSGEDQRILSFSLRSIDVAPVEIDGSARPESA